MNRLFLFLFGQRELSVGADGVAEALNICMRYGFVYRDFYCDGEGRAHFTVTLALAGKMQAAFSVYGVECRVERSFGLPRILEKYRARAGVLVGLVIASLLICFSGQFVWDIRIEGNTTLSRAEIIEELREGGFSVGAHIPTLDIGKTENEVLRSSDKLSWVSLNINGTVAYVEVKEREEAERDGGKKLPANLVSTSDAEIVLFEVYAGNTVVKVGDTVREGDLLVSGLYDSEAEGYRYTRAYGKVFAKTSHTIRVEIPFEYEKKVYTGRVFSEKSLNFFSKSIKVFSNCRNVDTTCDIIKYDENLFLVEGRLLPFGISTTKMVEYTYERAVRDEVAASELAFYELDMRLRELSDDAELLKKEIKTSMTEDAFLLECSVLCIENIAKQQEFTVE